MQKLKGLYPIADAQHINANALAHAVDEVLAAGVHIIQYRDKFNSQVVRHKTANNLKQLTKKHDALLIINDDVSLASSIDADGVHLGENDCSISDARHILGPNKIIGASCYNQYYNAVRAQKLGANYVAFGSFFFSPTKPHAPRASIELITQAKKELTLPICAIGGIHKDNMGPLITAGVDMVALISAIFSNLSTTKAISEYLPLLKQFDLTA